MIAPLILFPSLRARSRGWPDSVYHTVWPTVKGGCEGVGRSERLQAGNKNHCLVSLTASRSMCPLSMLVSKNLSVLNIYLYSHSALEGETVMTWRDRKGGQKCWDGIECKTMWSWLLSTEPVGHCNLYPVSVWCQPAREVWAGHRSWCQVSLTVWKQISIPVWLGIEPQYLLMATWNGSVASTIQSSTVMLSCLIPNLSHNLDNLHGFSCMAAFDEFGLFLLKHKKSATARNSP